MSKSPSIFIPALGGAALVLGVAYGVSSRDYAADKIAALESRVEKVSERAATASAQAKTLAAQSAALEVEIAEVTAAQQSDLTDPAPQSGQPFGLGRAAHAQEIAAWDVDVLPDGRGLPKGSGDVFTGEEVFADKCASCHGDFAEGVDNWPVLSGGMDTLADKDPLKTVGSFWPHLSTAWDYIHRSMPFGEAGTLSADETYAIVAYILYSNDLVDDDFELSDANFAEFEMYNKDGFVDDDRPEKEYAAWRVEPCMTACKDEVAVTMRSVFLVETSGGSTDSVMNPGTPEGLPTFTAAGPSVLPAAAGTAPVAPSEPVKPAAAAPDAADAPGPLIEAGAKVFKKCKACHQVGDSAKNRTGPHLNDLFGRTMGSVDGFKYSKVFTQAQAEARVWDEATLTDFLRQPKAVMKGTKMSFAGLKKDKDLEAIAAYLKSIWN